MYEPGPKSSSLLEVSLIKTGHHEVLVILDQNLADGFGGCGIQVEVKRRSAMSFGLGPRRTI